MRRTTISAALLAGALFAPLAARAQEPSGPAPLPPPSGDPVQTAPPFVDRAAPAAMPSAPPPPPRPIGLRLTLVPEWGYRSFRDQEPVGEMKRYTATGVPLIGGRVELYPMSFAPDPPVGLRDVGLTLNYSRAIGLTSRDIDTDTDVDTQWYQFGFGFRYRMLGGDNPLALGFTAGVQRSVFDFDTVPTARPVAIGRYTILPFGIDIRRSWDAFSLFADGRFLLPITVSAPGDRSAAGSRYGLSLAVAAALNIPRFFEIEARASYSLVSYALPSGIANSLRAATIYDEALTFSLGASFLF